MSLIQPKGILSKGDRYGIKVQNLRPQSAKPFQNMNRPLTKSLANNMDNNYSNYIGAGQSNLKQFKNQTLRHDATNGEMNQVRFNGQLQSRLNPKLGNPYMQTIRSAHLQNYGINQYLPKQYQQQNQSKKLVRPLSGGAGGEGRQKAILGDEHQTQQQLINMTQENGNSLFNNFQSNQQQQQQYQQQKDLLGLGLNKNRSMTRRPSDDNQTIFVNLNMNLDKEQLYQASITLKQALNDNLNQNQQLKTQIQFLNKEINTREKMLTEVISTGKLQNRTNDNFFMDENIRLRSQLQQQLELSQSFSNNSGQNQLTNAKNQQRFQEMSQNISLLQEQLLVKDKEIQMWRKQCEKMTLKNQKLGESSSLNKSGGGGRQKENSIISKDEFEHVKQKAIDFQTKYEGFLIENQNLIDQVQQLKDQINDKIDEKAFNLKNQLQLDLDKKIAENKNLKDQILAKDLKISENEQIIKDLKKQINRTEENYKQKIQGLEEDLQNQIGDDTEDKQQIVKLKQEYENKINQLRLQLNETSQKELENQLKNLKIQLENEFKIKEQILINERDQLKSKFQIQNNTLKEQLEKLQIDLTQSEARINSLTLKLEISQISDSRQQQNQKQIQHTISEGTVIQSQSRRSSNNSHQLKQSSNTLTLEKLPIIREEQIKKFYESMKRKLQLEQIQKDQLSKYIFSDNLENREDISIKDLASVLFMKFQLEKQDALNLARFIVEQPNQHTSQSGIQQIQDQVMIEYDPNKPMMNRKIVKFLYDKVLGVSYQLFTPDQVKLTLKKYRELAKAHFDSLESTFQLYDEDERGLITINDLREGLASFDIYDGRDKNNFECFALYLMELNHKNTEFIRISDVMESLYPERSISKTYVNKSQSNISKKLSQTNHNQQEMALKQNQSVQSQDISKHKSQVRFSGGSNIHQNLIKQQSQIQSEIQDDIIDEYQDDFELKQLNKQSSAHKMNPALIKSMSEDELIQKSEEAFQLITHYLQTQNLSLRNLLKDHIYDRKLAIIKNKNPSEKRIELLSDSQVRQTQEIEDDAESQRDINLEHDKTFEVINVEDFFNKFQIDDLNSSLQDCVVQIAAKPIQNNSNTSSQPQIHKSQQNPQMIFIYKDLEEILSAYGFEDETKPRNSRNLRYNMLDQKSIRIMNRLENYLSNISQQNGNLIYVEALREHLFKDKAYKKTIKNSQIGNKKQFKMEFVKSREFFETLKRIGVRKSEEPHQNLVEFLTIDAKIYKTGLVIKKIEKLLKECSENEYLKSIGMQKKVRDSLQKKNTLIIQNNSNNQTNIREQSQQRQIDVYQSGQDDDYAIQEEVYEEINSDRMPSSRGLEIENSKRQTRNMPKSPHAQTDIQTHKDQRNKRLPLIEEEEGTVSVKHQSEERHRTSHAEVQKIYQEDIIDNQNMHIVNQYSESINEEEMEDIDHYSDDNN